MIHRHFWHVSDNDRAQHKHPPSPCACSYFSDCERMLGEVPPHTVLESRSGDGWLASAETRELWAAAYPTAQCDVAPLTEPAAAAAAMEASLRAVHADWKERAAAAAAGMYDVAAAAARQAVFHYQVSLPHFSHADFAQRGIARCDWLRADLAMRLFCKCGSKQTTLVWLTGT